MSSALNGNSCQCQIGQCLLCEAKLYRGLMSEQVCGIRGLLVQAECGPHEVLFREGDPSTHVFVLRQGLLKITSLGMRGREQIIGLAVPGRLLGLQSMHSQSYCFTAETLSPISVCKLRRSDMLQVLEQNPGVSLQVIDMLNQELTEAQALIRVLGQKTAEERVAWFLLTLANADTEPFKMNPLWLSRREIAELLGLTTETVSRLISEFRRASLIDTPRGCVRILNLPRLQARANFLSGTDAAFPHRLTAG